MGTSPRAFARNVLLAVAGFTLAASATSARADWVYHNSGGGYSVTLPDDWMPIPADALPHPATVSPIDAAVGFQKKGKALFTGPMFFVMPQKYADGSPPTDAELPQYIESLRKLDYGRTMKDALSGSIDKAPYQAWSDAPYWDKETDSLLLTLHIVINGSEPRTGIIAHHVGRYSGQATFCYSSEQGWENEQPTFVQISNSFKFDDGWGFDGRNHHPLMSLQDAMILGAAVLTVLVFHFKPRKRVHMPSMMVAPPAPAGFDQVLRSGIQPVPMKEEEPELRNEGSIFATMPEPSITAPPIAPPMTPPPAPMPKPEIHVPQPPTDFKAPLKMSSSVQTFLGGF